MNMDLINHDYPQMFLNHHETPCISLYQPTHRTFPERDQDSIRFKNLVKEIEKSLEEKYPPHAIEALLKPFNELLEEYEFWNHMLDGLAVLSTPDFFRVYKLPRSVPEIAIVADTFHIKPLIRLMQSADRYQILGLDREHVQLFEGNRDNIERMSLHADVPSTIEQALGSELSEPRLTVSTNYGMGAKGNSAMFHGHGGRKDDEELDAKRFFHIVDKKILDCHSKKSHLPLILAALPENQGLFRQLSHNPYLVEKGIDVDPESLTLESLREKAWQLIEPYYLERLQTLINSFKEAQAKHHGSDQIDDVAVACIEGRVATLLIAAEKRIPGYINTASGQVQRDEGLDPHVNDVLDELGEQVLKTGGEVIVVPEKRMPTLTGAAAIYRY